ncbi:hypothetical protein RRG08_043753 [Elysia crispata]|uniref:Uncharacterized protein n=1 Tax=Elysia crispata TaxID=231223 RepID=A0AAE0ZN61_9GAST|nr:hypothetical protein RRG08_043753 [Elysia crispata]
MRIMAFPRKTKLVRNATFTTWPGAGALGVLKSMRHGWAGKEGGRIEGEKKNPNLIKPEADASTQEGINILLKTLHYLVWKTLEREFCQWSPVCPTVSRQQQLLLLYLCRAVEPMLYRARLSSMAPSRCIKTASIDANKEWRGQLVHTKLTSENQAAPHMATTVMLEH